MNATYMNAKIQWEMILKKRKGIIKNVLSNVS